MGTIRSPHARHPRCTRAGVHPRLGVTVWALLAVLLAACGAAVTSQAPEAAAPARPSASPETAAALFGNNADAPVDLTDVGAEEVNGQTIRDVTFPSTHGGVVPAYLAEPTQDHAGVGVLITPGIPEKRFSYAEDISRFACAGAIAMVVDAPWARDPDRVSREFTFTPKDADEQVQLVIDLRRAVDILEDLGAERIGFDAISYGAGIGAILAGVEDRIDAFSLASGGIGPVRRFVSADGNALYPLTSKSPAERRKWIDAMKPLEPEHFIGDTTAPILFLAGREDTIVTADEIELISQAAGDTAEVRWYDAGHDLNLTAYRDHIDWLAERLGLDEDRVDECFPADPS